MIINNYSLVNRINILNKYGAKRLPQRISYAITKDLIVMEKEYDVYVKALNNLFNRYNESLIRDDNGEVIVDESGIPTVSDDSADEFRKELSDLLNIEIDIDIYTIDESCFDYDDNDGKYDALSSNDIRILQSIICNKWFNYID